MDTSKRNQSELEFSCGAGIVHVNLYTKRILLELPDVSIGENNSVISMAHIYNSHSVTEPKGGINEGHNWKLNMRQHIVREFKNPGDIASELETVQMGGMYYLYYDNYGQKHYFVPLGSQIVGIATANTYYDKTGLGLTLFDIPAEQKIYILDMQSNKLTFTISGEIKEISSGINDGIGTSFQYTQGKLTQITSFNKSYRHVMLSYNSNSLLEKMTAATERGVSIYDIYKDLRYYYSGNKLIRISEMVSGIEVLKMSFFYNGDGALTYAIDNDLSNGLKFDYTENQLTVSNGKIGMNADCTEIVTFNAFAATQITFGGGYTSVLTDKNVVYDYYFNAEGATSSVFERRGQSMTDYMALFKSNGKNILDEPDSSNPFGGEIINQSKSVIISGSYLRTKEANVNNPVWDYLASRDSHLKYICSFWLKHNSVSASNKVIIYAGPSESVSKIYPYEIYIDNTAKNVWQYVSVPFSVIDNKAVKYFEIQFLDGNNVSTAEIADVRVFDTPEVESMFVKYHNGVDESIYTSVADIHSVRICTEYNVAGYLRKKGRDFYFTESDLAITAQNMFLANGGSFSIVHSNGKQRIPNATNIFLFPFENFDERNRISLIENGKASFCIFSDDTDNFLRCPILNGHITEFTYTQQGILMTKNVSDSICYQNLTDYDGRIIYEQDAYNVKVTYIYDSVGNLINKSAANLSGGLSLNEAYNYDHPSPIYREYVNEMSGNGSTTEFTYNIPLFTPNSVETDGLGKFFAYDSSGEKLTGITARNSEGSVLAGNTISYDMINSKMSLKDNQVPAAIYEYSFDEIGRITSAKLGSNQIIGRTYTDYIAQYPYKGNNYADVSKITERYYEGSSTVVSDKYGKPIFHEEGGGTIYYDYHGAHGSDNPYDTEDPEHELWQPNYASPSSSEICKIIDPYTATIIFNRDENERTTGYKIKNNSGTIFSAKQVTQKKLEYKLGQNYTQNIETAFENEAIDDGGFTNPIISFMPRIRKVSSKDSTMGEGDNDFVYYYKYDSLGRPEYRKSERMKTTYSYRRNSDGSATLKLGGISNSIMPQETQINYSNSIFDMRDNLKQFTETVSFKVGTQQKNYSRTYFYTYDDLGRVLTDECRLGSSIIFKKQYQYSNGRLAKILNNNFVESTFTHDSYGRVSQANGVDYGYDYCGNVSGCSKFDAMLGNDDTRFTYTRKNLLSEYYHSQMPLGGGGVIDYAYYTYNHQGYRTEKSGLKANQTFDIKYHLDGGKILGEDMSDGKKLRYFYDLNGIVGFRYTSGSGYTDYTYVKDLHGNITKLISESEGLVCQYVYDALGKCTVYDKNNAIITNLAHIGNINPFRFKSYYYDFETGLVYMNTPTGYRYYDPEIGQFISPDYSSLDPYSIGGLNPYSLCSAFGVSNPLQVPSNYDNINTSLPLAADGDSESGGGGWLSKVFSWYNNLHWGWKVGVGVGLFLAGLGLTVATGGAALPFIASFGIGVGIGTAIGTGINLAMGADFGDALLGGFADSVLFSGVFAFGSGAIRAAKYGYAYATKNAEIMAKLFTHNPNAASYVLGKYATDGTSYTAVAKAGGHTYFSMSNRKWARLLARFGGEEGMWQINRAFLIQQAGKLLVTSHSIEMATGFFLRELIFLGLR